MNFVFDLTGVYQVLAARISPDCYGETDVIYGQEIVIKNVNFVLDLTGFYQVLEARISPDCYGETDVIYAQETLI